MFTFKNVICTTRFPSKNIGPNNIFENSFLHTLTITRNPQYFFHLCQSNKHKNIISFKFTLYYINYLQGLAPTVSCLVTKFAFIALLLVCIFPLYMFCTVQILIPLPELLFLLSKTLAISITKKKTFLRLFHSIF